MNSDGAHLMATNILVLCFIVVVTLQVYLPGGDTRVHLAKAKRRSRSQQERLPPPTTYEQVNDGLSLI